MIDKQLAVTIFYGGISSEREISLETGKNIGMALADRGMLVNYCDVTPDFVRSPVIPECDVAYIALHGKFGEDGGIQAVFEKANIPFTGSSSISSSLAMNKVEAQRIFSKAGIPVPKSISLDMEREKNIPEDIGISFPVVVKPSREGSTFGISVANNQQELRIAVLSAAKFDSLILIEEFIKGREFTVGVIGEIVLPVLEVIPEHEIFTHECKYHDKASFEFSKDLPMGALLEMQLHAREAYQALNCSGIARVDFIYSDSGIPYILEINTVPGMTSHSLVPMAAAKIGISFEKLCGLGVKFALEDFVKVKGESSCS